MVTRSKPPTLREAWLDDVKTTWKHHKWNVFPWKIATCLGLGFLVSFNVQSAFFYPRNLGVAVSVYSGLLAFNALTMALAWSGIGRVYDSMTSPKFSNFLQHTGVLAKYHFILGFIHTIQTLAATISIAGLALSLIVRLPGQHGIPIFWERIALGCTLSATLYALWWAYSAAQVARDLSWHHATFDGLDDQEIESIKLAVDNTEAHSRTKGQDA